MTHADRLRADIDAGRTGDKVPFPDPAAAPLGTDDEAGNAARGHHPLRAHLADEAPGDADKGSLGSGTDERGRPYDDVGAVMPGRSFPVAVLILLAGIVALGIAVALVLNS